MSAKCNKSSLIIKRIIALVLILGVNTYVFNTSFAQEGDGSMYDFVMAKTLAVNDPDKQVGSFDPNTAPNLPIGLITTIAGADYIICIDSAYFLEDGAYFSAYMALEFPGGNKKLAFAAKDIKFNPEGIIGGEQAKLMLVSDHLIELGPNTALALPGDGSNYVNWGCNGFESVNLHGSFIMSGKMLTPVEPQDTVVTAEFQVNVEDLHNMMVAVDFSPFAVAGLDDFEFTVSEASVDMSDFYNPQGVVMPAVYNELYPEDIKLWRGFHLKYFEVKLPEKMSGHDSLTEIYARDMFIDESGVTGFVGANNILSLGEGDASGWGFSIDNLELGFTTNELTQGGMAGEIKVPMMNNNSLEYIASITKDEESHKAEYYFAASPGQDMVKSVPALKSTITIDESSVLSMTVKNDKFDPRLNLTGDWKLDSKAGKFDGITFQNLVLVTESPFVSSGQFSLVGSVGVSIAGYGVSLNEIGLKIKPSGEVGIETEAGLNLGKGNSVIAGFTVFTKIEQNENTGKQQWLYDSFQMNTIAIDINTQAIAMKGLINFMHEDPVYGDGFSGQLVLGIGGMIDDLTLACIFGKVSGYRYFAIDGSAPVNLKIGNITITRISGGVSYHMLDPRTPQSIMDQARAVGNAPGSSLGADFTPSNDINLGFRAGVQFVYTKEQMLNGDVVFSIQFNSDGGLQSILLAGEAYMMTTIAERATSTNFAKGTIAIGYDNQEKIFDAQLQAYASFEGALTANIWSQLYISPNLWYFHLGTPDNPCTANALNLATMSAYFMFGQNLMPMPLPPPQVSSVLGGMSNGRDVASIVNGDGISAGANLIVGFDNSFNVWGKWYAYASGYVGAGFDMTLYKYGVGTHCSGSTDPFGANRWYMNGQLYAYGGLSAGAVKKEDDGSISNSFEVISGSMAMLLQGKLPKPSYVYGGVNLQASIFGIFNLDVTVDFDLGTDCQIVN